MPKTYIPGYHNSTKTKVLNEGGIIWDLAIIY